MTNIWLKKWYQLKKLILRQINGNGHRELSIVIILFEAERVQYLFTGHRECFISYFLVFKGNVDGLGQVS